MKHSIARQLSMHVLHILFIALAILFTCSFFMVSNIVKKRTQTYARTLVSTFADFAVYLGEANGFGLDGSGTDMYIALEEYFCSWYDIDYAYIYVPDVENNTITFIAVSGSESNEKHIDNHMIGYTKEYTLTEEERNVWDGSAVFSYSETNNEFGHEFTTAILMRDSMANRALACIDCSFSSIYRQIGSLFILFALIIILVLTGVYFFVYFIIRNKVSRPARMLSQSMEDFLTDGIRPDLHLEEKGSAEYTLIASSFNRMTRNIDSYLENIHTLTRDQAQQQTEIDIASHIQKGFLPNSHYVAAQYEIRAVMTPARDIGGDLYDYLPLDDHRVLLVIADVSGKGVSASMFMSVTLVLIRQFAKMGLSPSEILQKTNETLSENNSAMLFTTAFVGIYDDRTKELTYSNAGHNLPYIVGAELTPLDGGKGALLGLFEDEEYENAVIRLRMGDTLFLYTDGVNEATDPDQQFFGTERLEESLRSFKSSRMDDAVSYVYDRVHDFTRGAEPHDDITIITLMVKNTVELVLAPDIHEMEKIRNAILALPRPRSEQLNLCLSAEESFVNICSYAFEHKDKSQEKVYFMLSISDKIMMRFSDGGVEYDPLAEINTPENYDIDRQIGGLGKFLTFSLTDEAKYEYRNGKNILTLIKYFEEDNQ